MKTLFIALALMLGLTAASSAKELTLGEPVKMDLIKPLETLLAKPATYIGKEVTVKGKIEKVCKKRGCWADFVAEDKKLRVKVADGEIEIPLHAIGSVAYATGVLSSIEFTKEQTIAYLEHMAEDAGEKFDPSTVKQGMTLYQLKSDAVKIL